MDSFLARQPIFDAQMNLFAYEILARSGLDNFFQNTNQNHATERVLSEALTVWGLDSLLGDSQMFVNLTREAILSEEFRILPPERTTLEILENVELDPPIIEICRSARAGGYTVALDDYELDEQNVSALAEFDIVKVDFLETTSEQRRTFMNENRHLPCRWLAEKIETHDVFTEALDLGCSLFQGYFFCRPQLMKQRGIQSRSSMFFRLLDQVQRPTLNRHELERTIHEDVGLSYKLLKFLNSASFGIREPIESIAHAIRLLGDRKIKQWALMIATGGLGAGKPNELLNATYVRAKFCEFVGPSFSLKQSDDVDFFTLGLFSMLDALLDRRMEEIIGDLNLSSIMTQTLVGEPTPISPALSLAIAIERCRFDEVSTIIREFDLGPRFVFETYRRCTNWAHEALVASGLEPNTRLAS